MAQESERSRFGILLMLGPVGGTLVTSLTSHGSSDTDLCPLWAPPDRIGLKRSHNVSSGIENKCRVGFPGGLCHCQEVLAACYTLCKLFDPVHCVS